MNFLGRGFQNLRDHRQTDRQTENTTTVYSEAVTMHTKMILSHKIYIFTSANIAVKAYDERQTNKQTNKQGRLTGRHSPLSSSHQTHRLFQVAWAMSMDHTAICHSELLFYKCIISMTEQDSWVKRYMWHVLHFKSSKIIASDVYFAFITLHTTGKDTFSQTFSTFPKSCPITFKFADFAWFLGACSGNEQITSSSGSSSSWLWDSLVMTPLRWRLDRYSWRWGRMELPGLDRKYMAGCYTVHQTCWKARDKHSRV